MHPTAHWISSGMFHQQAVQQGLDVGFIWKCNTSMAVATRAGPMLKVLNWLHIKPNTTQGF